MMLTWNELKQLVEEKLEETGKDGDIRISWIDIGLHESINNTEVEKRTDLFATAQG